MSGPSAPRDEYLIVIDLREESAERSSCAECQPGRRMGLGKSARTRMIAFQSASRPLDRLGGSDRSRPRRVFQSRRESFDFSLSHLRLLRAHWPLDRSPALSFASRARESGLVTAPPWKTERRRMTKIICNVAAIRLGIEGNNLAAVHAFAFALAQFESAVRPEPLWRKIAREIRSRTERITAGPDSGLHHQ